MKLGDVDRAVVRESLWVETCMWKYDDESGDFDRVVTFFDTLYASSRLNLPLKGILIIGY